ncbi:YihY/virulence factor BrkB family protein [Enemella dayhoffiae]|uniref:YihY/virulence factor BrkB family protein n=1 Tax=Enemella dayhoffiae TaxID=2016507 RepID=UPI001E546ABB|nr:YihY/virulence factor BrkB family protein [Enemella dayhoffiae]
MASETAAEKADVPDPDDRRKPQHPKQIRGGGWKLTLRNALSEFTHDQGTDLAATLTYFSVLALFPGLLAVFSLVGVVGQSQQTVATVLELIGGFAPADVVEQIRGPITQMATSGASGWTLVAGLLGALWSASGYVGAFGRAMNRVYEVDEGRPVWKLRLQMVLLTAVVVTLVSLVLIGLVVSGPIAESVTRMIGLGSLGQTVFAVVKWPLILLVVVVIIALLYYFTPNVQQPKFRWISIGSVIAVVIWIVLSALFGLYVANFANYNKTYGALAGVIIFLLWVWITNIALLLGAEIDSEMERSRQLQAGLEAEETLQLPPRDTRQSEKKEKKRRELREEGRQVREESEREGDAPFSDDNNDQHPEKGSGGSSPQ